MKTIKIPLMIIFLAIITFCVVALPRQLNPIYDTAATESRIHSSVADYEIQSSDVALYYINNFTHIEASKAYEQQTFFEGAEEKITNVIEKVFSDGLSLFGENDEYKVSFYLSTNVLAVINSRPVILRFSEISLSVGDATICLGFEEKTNTMLRIYYNTETQYNNLEEIKKVNSSILSCADDYFKNILHLQDDDLYRSEGAYETTRYPNGELMWHGYAEVGIDLHSNHFVKEEKIKD